MVKSSMMGILGDHAIFFAMFFYHGWHRPGLGGDDNGGYYCGGGDGTSGDGGGDGGRPLSSPLLGGGGGGNFASGLAEAR